MKYIDLTHIFTDNMPVFPGDPQATRKQTVFIDKDGNNDHAITTAMHVGTHTEITEAFVKQLIEHKVKMVGMDTASPEHNPPMENS